MYIIVSQSPECLLLILDILQEGGEGGLVQGDGEILPAVRPLPALDELVVPELGELRPQREVRRHEELGPALAVQLHEGQALVIVSLLHRLQLVPERK